MTEIIAGTAVLSAIVLTLTFLVMGARSYLQPDTELSIAINDGPTVRARSGMTLLNALDDAGYQLPGTCGGKGTCGLCRVRMPGGGDALPIEKSKLSRKDIREGIRLACQIVLRNDTAIALPASMLNAVSVTGIAAECRALTPLIREIVIDLPVGCQLDPEPGSFVEIEIPPYELVFSTIEVPATHRSKWEQLGLNTITIRNDRTITRAYSVANRPQDSGRIVLNIRLAIAPPGSNAPPGIGSSYLFGLQKGMDVQLRGPFGYFRLQPTKREMVFIGGGVGMAPLRSMIFNALEHEKTRRTISYWYGARSTKDLFYADEFEELARRHENFTWTVALSEPAAKHDERYRAGFIHDVVRASYLESHPAPDECEYYLCGPPMMIRAVRLMLEELGVAPDNIFFDDFGV